MSDSIDTTIQSGANRPLHKGGIFIGIVASALVVFGLSVRAYSSKDLTEWTAAQAITTVAIVAPVKSDANRLLELPGRFEAFATAPIYARVPGYLKNWYVDIGAPVKAGQLLGEIETPDLDQQLLQARADMENAKANLALAESTLKRMQSLLSSKVISQQEYENRARDFEAKQAQYQSTKANYDRLDVNKRFARITAPFDGVVTERNTDIGALINIGSSANPPLFTISDASKLRLYVKVPQNYLSSVKTGDEAQITVPEHQGKLFKATVVAASGAIDAATNTALIQLNLDNAEGELLPGSYARVSFNVQSAADSLSIPASALIFNASGLQVATVGEDNKVALKSISITRDLGKSLEISGLQLQDKVIDNPPDGIGNGELVNINTPKALGYK